VATPVLAEGEGRSRRISQPLEVGPQHLARAARLEGHDRATGHPPDGRPPGNRPLRDGPGVVGEARRACQAHRIGPGGASPRDHADDRDAPTPKAL